MHQTLWPKIIIRQETYKKGDGTVIVVNRKNPKLLDNACPTIFPNQPKYNSTNAPTLRKNLQTRLIEKGVNVQKIKEKQIEKQKILDFANFVSQYKIKLKKLKLTVIENTTYVCFLNIVDLEAGCPRIISFLKIKNDLSIEMYRKTVIVDKNDYENILGKSLLCDTWPKLRQLNELLSMENDPVDGLDSKLNNALAILKECYNMETSLNRNVTNKLKFLTEQLHLVLHEANHKWCVLKMFNLCPKSRIWC